MCNTIIWHGDAYEERLLNTKDLSVFSKTILNIEATWSKQELQNLKKLRELFRVFFLNHINILPLSNVKKQLSDFFSKYHFVFGFDSKGIKPKWVLKSKNKGLIEHLILDFFNFLESADMKRVKKCLNPNCSILFYDASKNNKRSWCSMRSCGNLAKARAFYQRSKKM